MPPVLIKILLSLLWATIGGVAAWLSFFSLQKQAGVLDPNSGTPLTQLPKIMAGRTLRLVLTGVALYIAVRMDALYALVFVVALTITTWILVVALNKKADKSVDDLNTR